MNIKTFDYILDCVKDDLQGYSNFRKCIEAEDKLTVALRYLLVTVVRINILETTQHSSQERLQIWK